jgi:PAS domain S-box-containing protein
MSEIDKSSKQADITSAARAARALIIIENMYQFVGLLSVEGLLLEANRAALQAAGIDHGDVIGKYFWNTPWWIGSPPSQERLKDAIAQAARGEFVRFEEAHFAEDPEKKIIVDFSIKPIYDNAGQIIYLLPEGRDITEKKRIEAEMARKNAELAKKHDELMQSYKDADRIFSALAEMLPGKVLEGKYLIKDKIGAGGYGAVYKAIHQGLNRPVAVKIFRPQLGKATLEDLDRFRLEGISSCRVNHPNAILMLDSGVSSEGIVYLVMELLEGRTLIGELAEAGRISLQRCAEIIIPICGALAEAHRTGIIHRDIKPGNIFLHKIGDFETIKLIDFGIAKMTDQAFDVDVKTLTVNGTIIGTPIYMAPERLTNKPYDGRSDVYSLAVTCYEMLTGFPPFDPSRKSFIEIILAHINETPRSLREIVPDLPADVEALIMRALSKNPADRPAAQDFAQQLAALLNIKTQLTGWENYRATELDKDSQQTSENKIAHLETIEHPSFSNAGRRTEPIDINDNSDCG